MRFSRRVGLLILIFLLISFGSILLRIILIRLIGVVLSTADLDTEELPWLTPHTTPAFHAGR